MNLGEPKYSRREEKASTSDKKREEAQDVLAVGLTHSTEEVQETAQREGVSSQAMSFEGTSAIVKDGVTVEEYGVKLKENLKDLINRMKALHYYPQAVRRVYIPKGEGKVRGLGIPAVEDKIVQMGIKRILEAIYEVDLSDSSYGFRPKRSRHREIL